MSKMIQYHMQVHITVELQAEDARDALPAGLGFVQDALDWGLEHYEGDIVKAVTLVRGGISAAGAGDEDPY